MANINEVGYQKVRQFVLENWKYIEIQDENGTAIKRLGTDNGLTITGDKTTQQIEYKVVISGTDSSFNGKTVNKSAIYDVGSGGEAIAEATFTAFTFESEDDELTVIHRLKIPEVI